MLGLSAAAVLAYSVSVVDRALGPGGGSIISRVNATSDYVWNFNAAWTPTPTNPGGALFVRVTDTNLQRIAARIAAGAARDNGLGSGCAPTAPGSTQSHSLIAFVHATTPDGLRYEFLNESHIIVPVAPSLDPRATYRPLTGEYFLTYQCNFMAPDGSLHRKTFLASSTTPADASSWLNGCTAPGAGESAYRGWRQMAGSITPPTAYRGDCSWRRWRHSSRR
jgi:hypothetical protein